MSKEQPQVFEKIAKLITEKGGINLDVGCGGNRQPGWIGLDMRELPGVDIIHDFEQFPFPLPDECAISILLSHVVEHVNPSKFGFLNFMAEMWRLLKMDGRLLIVTPYAGSHGYWQDPSHCNPCNETTWAYFAPDHPSKLYEIYRPPPFKIVGNAWQSCGNLECILQKIPEVANVGENN